MVTIQSPKASCAWNRESKALNAVIPDLAAVEVRDFKVRKSLAPCSDRKVPISFLTVISTT